MTLRNLIERPFRHYADFSGRSGRAEFWLLILVFVLVTELAWWAGFGGMQLAGYEPHDHGSRFHSYERQSSHTDAQSDLYEFFDDCWKTHKHLFGPTRVEEISKLSEHPNGINLTVPLNQPVTETLKEVKDLIERKQTERLISQSNFSPTKSPL